MMEDSKCNAPALDLVDFLGIQKVIEHKIPKLHTAEWSDEYKMWVVYPIYHYSDGTKKDASGQIII